MASSNAWHVRLINKKTKQPNAMHEHARVALAAHHRKKTKRKNQGQKREIQPN